MSSVIENFDPFDNPTRLESPLHHVDISDATALSGEAGVILHEKRFHGHLTLRCDIKNKSLNNALQKVLGVGLPLKPGTYTESKKARISWLSPDEWLIVVAEGSEALIEKELRSVLQGHFSVVDVSGGQTIFNLSGPQVGALMKKSSVYDFHPGHFGAGRCVSTTFAKATALIIKNPDDSFDLVVRRSFSDYLFRWIEDASREYGFVYKG